MYKFYIVYINERAEHTWMFARADKELVDEAVVADFYEQIAHRSSGNNILLHWEYVGLWDNKNKQSLLSSEKRAGIHG